MNARNKAILWARDLLTLKFVVLDTETTGLHPAQHDEALTIGVIDKHGKTLLDVRIKPTKSIQAEAERAHGISYADAMKFPPFSEAHPHLARVLDHRPVVSYCAAGYDRAIIQATCLNNRLPIIDFEAFYQVIPPFADFYGEWNNYHGNNRWQSLTVAAEHFGIKIKNAHSAIGDCLMTLKVVQAMAREELSNA